MSVVERLFAVYDDFRIDIQDWEIPDEGLTVLWGPSGSGKTSILRLLLGLDRARELRWKFSGVMISDLPVEERRLGMVFQNYQVFSHLSGRQNLIFAGQARGLSQEEIAERVDHFSRTLELESFIESPAKILSGGERQRIALAVALIGKPRLLLLDEAFSSLDKALRSKARALLMEIIQKEKIPALLVSHDEQDLQIARHISRIDCGKIIF